MSNYRRAGINDVAAFYADKFVTVCGGAEFFRDRLRRRGVRNGQARWFDQNIAGGSAVLDFGCGSGNLHFLRSKGCRVFGIELSQECARRAEAAGYEKVFVGALEEAPVEGHGFFDYVVSQDVFGHIEFADKDQVIARLRRFLRLGGVMLHAIESGPMDYDAMSDADLRAFVHVDGHVGVEPRSAVLERFRRQFEHVDGEVCFVHCLPDAQLLKGVSEYGSYIDPDLVAFVAHMSEPQRLAWDLAMGFVMESLQAYGVPSDDRYGGNLLLRASDQPLRSANHEVIGSLGDPLEPGCSVPLDHPGLLSGWHPMEIEDSRAHRWLTTRALLRLPIAAGARCLGVSLRAPLRPPVRVRISESRGGACAVAELSAESSILVPLPGADGSADRVVAVTIEVDRSYNQSWEVAGGDTRELALAVTAIHVC
jgi:SAM-dependent methyltransferase